MKWISINSWILGLMGLLKGLCKMGHALSLELKWSLGITKKIVKESNKQSHVQKDNFEFVEHGDHEAQDHCPLWGQ